MKKGSDYYAADQKSSNFTFVNGVQLSPVSGDVVDRQVYAQAFG